MRITSSENLPGMSEMLTLTEIETERNVIGS